ASIEAQTAKALSLRRVKIVLHDSDESADRNASALAKLLETAEHQGAGGFENNEALRAFGFTIAYWMSRDARNLGLLVVEASPNALTSDVRAVLEVLAGQIAVAIDDFRLVEENLRLERKMAERERLAALGQMAATVAHEVKNPLSAIKSIAQVM